MKRGGGPGGAEVVVGGAAAAAAAAVVEVVSAGQTDLCLALPGTIKQTGNYHFKASSI